MLRPMALSEKSYEVRLSSLLQFPYIGAPREAPCSSRCARAATSSQAEVTTLKSDLLLDILPLGALGIDRRQPYGVARECGTQRREGIDKPSPAWDKAYKG